MCTWIYGFCSVSYVNTGRYCIENYKVNIIQNNTYRMQIILCCLPSKKDLCRALFRALLSQKSTHRLSGFLPVAVQAFLAVQEPSIVFLN